MVRSKARDSTGIYNEGGKRKKLLPKKENIVAVGKKRSGSGYPVTQEMASGYTWMDWTTREE